MNRYTFRSPYGDYTFSDSQIESVPQLNREEKDILHGLAAWQTKSYETPSIDTRRYDVDNTEGRRTLTKTPAEYTFTADLSDKRWYETMAQFIERKTKEFEKKNTVKVKEVKRENIKVERSTFEDGTEITKWDKDLRYFY